MKLNSTVFAVYFVFTLLVLSTFIFAPSIQQKYYNFVLQMPDVEAYPGDNVTIIGNITNTGKWTLRQLNMTLDGMPYAYEINPSYFQEVRILRDWNPQVGVFKLPYNFTVNVLVPQNATGAYLVTLSAQEFGSWRQVSNETQFILKILSMPKISATDLSVPSKVTKFEPFTATLTLKNDGIAPAIINASMIVPGDWQITEKEKQVAMAGNSTEKVLFNITPSGSPGALTAKASYEFRGNVTSITKSSLMITPAAPVVAANETSKSTGFAAFVDYVKSLSPIILGIIVLIVVILVWNLYKIIKVFSKKKNKPEEMKENNKGKNKTNTIASDQNQIIGT